MQYNYIFVILILCFYTEFFYCVGCKKMDYISVEKIIGYCFKNKDLLVRAFTHRSFDNNLSNEKLEFLGDSVLGFVVTNILYTSDRNEGQLTKERAKIVCEENLSKTITSLGLSDFLISKNLIISNAIKCDLCEAIIGAIYLDSGLDESRKFIEKFISFNVETKKDFKTELQEFVQQSGTNTIVYKTEMVAGTMNEPVFETNLYIDEKLISTEKGKSKRIAEQAAAKTALCKLNYLGEN